MRKGLSDLTHIYLYNLVRGQTKVDYYFTTFERNLGELFNHYFRLSVGDSYPTESASNTSAIAGSIACSTNDCALSLRWSGYNVVSSGKYHEYGATDRSCCPGNKIHL